MKPQSLQNAIKAAALQKKDKFSRGQWKEPVVKQVKVTAEDMKQSQQRGPAAAGAPSTTLGAAPGANADVVVLAMQREMQALKAEFQNLKASVEKEDNKSSLATRGGGANDNGSKLQEHVDVLRTEMDEIKEQLEAEGLVGMGEKLEGLFDVVEELGEGLEALQQQADEAFSALGEGGGGGAGAPAGSASADDILELQRQVEELTNHAQSQQGEFDDVQALREIVDDQREQLKEQAGEIRDLKRQLVAVTTKAQQEAQKEAKKVATDLISEQQQQQQQQNSSQSSLVNNGVNKSFNNKKSYASSDLTSSTPSPPSSSAVSSSPFLAAQKTEQQSSNQSSVVNNGVKKSFKSYATSDLTSTSQSSAVSSSPFLAGQTTSRANSNRSLLENSSRSLQASNRSLQASNQSLQASNRSLALEDVNADESDSDMDQSPPSKQEEHSSKQVDKDLSDSDSSDSEKEIAKTKSSKKDDDKDSSDDSESSDSEKEIVKAPPRRGRRPTPRNKSVSDAATSRGRDTDKTTTDKKKRSSRRHKSLSPERSSPGSPTKGKLSHASYSDLKSTHSFDVDSDEFDSSDDDDDNGDHNTMVSSEDDDYKRISQSVPASRGPRMCRRGSIQSIASIDSVQPQKKKLSLLPHKTQAVYEEQRKDKVLRKLMLKGKTPNMSVRKVHGKNLVFFSERVYLPSALREATMEYYKKKYRYNPLNAMEEHVFWPDMKNEMRNFTPSKSKK